MKPKVTYIPNIEAKKLEEMVIELGACSMPCKAKGKSLKQASKSVDSPYFWWWFIRRRVYVPDRPSWVKALPDPKYGSLENFQLVDELATAASDKAYNKAIASNNPRIYDSASDRSDAAGLKVWQKYYVVGSQNAKSPVSKKPKSGGKRRTTKTTKTNAGR